MSTFDATGNGRGSAAWSSSWTHFHIDRPSAGYCRVIFDHPPVNTITALTIIELAELVSLIEQDRDLNVVVFGSANPDFYLGDYDAEHDPDLTGAPLRGPTGLDSWPDLLVRLSHAPAVSIASIRGRVAGAGSEFVLACDLRFAAHENTTIDHSEVRLGDIPGRGAVPRLPRLVGRARTLEILLLVEALNGPRAERYGYVNRLIADDQLDDEVDEIATRLAGFDHNAIAETKSYVDQVAPPPNSGPSAVRTLRDA